MAVFNEIDEGGLNGILSRRLGMPGGSPAPSLAPEIMPQLVLESDRPEWGWLKGEMRCAGHFFEGPVAAQRSYYEFVNPASSNSIITIDQIENVTNQDLIIARAAFTSALGGVSSYAGVSDLRFRFRSHQMQITSGNAAAASLSTQGIFTLLTGNVHGFTGSIVMPPASLVRIFADLDNTAIGFNLRFYERVAQSGELV